MMHFTKPNRRGRTKQLRLHRLNREFSANLEQKSPASDKKTLPLFCRIDHGLSVCYKPVIMTRNDLGDKKPSQTSVDSEGRLFISSLFFIEALNENHEMTIETVIGA